MSTTYTKSAGAKLEVIDGEAMLLPADRPYVFALSDSGAVLWEALDHFQRPEELEGLLREAHDGLSAAEAAAAVRGFLETLVEHGLATVRIRRRVAKKSDIMAELVGAELIVLSRADRKVHLLNETGAVLWAALDNFGSSEELEDLLTEAWSGKGEAEIRDAVGDFLDRLIDLGLLEETA